MNRSTTTRSSSQGIISFYWAISHQEGMEKGLQGNLEAVFYVNKPTSLQDLQPRWLNFVQDRGFDNTTNFSYGVYPTISETASLIPAGYTVFVKGVASRPPVVDATAAVMINNPQEMIGGTKVNQEQENGSNSKNDDSIDWYTQADNNSSDSDDDDADDDAEMTNNPQEMIGVTNVKKEESYINSEDDTSIDPKTQEDNSSSDDDDDAEMINNPQEMIGCTKVKREENSTNPEDVDARNLKRQADNNSFQSSKKQKRGPQGMTPGATAIKREEDATSDSVSSEDDASTMRQADNSSSQSQTKIKIEDDVALEEKPSTRLQLPVQPNQPVVLGGETSPGRVITTKEQHSSSDKETTEDSGSKDNSHQNTFSPSGGVSGSTDSRPSRIHLENVKNRDFPTACLLDQAKVQRVLQPKRGKWGCNFVEGAALLFALEKEIVLLPSAPMKKKLSRHHNYRRKLVQGLNYMKNNREQLAVGIFECLLRGKNGKKTQQHQAVFRYDLSKHQVTIFSSQQDTWDDPNDYSKGFETFNEAVRGVLNEAKDFRVTLCLSKSAALEGEKVMIGLDPCLVVNLHKATTGKNSLPGSKLGEDHYDKSPHHMNADQNDVILALKQVASSGKKVLDKDLLILPNPAHSFVPWNDAWEDDKPRFVHPEVVKKERELKAIFRKIGSAQAKLDQLKRSKQQSAFEKDIKVLEYRIEQLKSSRFAGYGPQRHHPNSTSLSDAVEEPLPSAANNKLLKDNPTIDFLFHHHAKPVNMATDGSNCVVDAINSGIGFTKEEEKHFLLQPGIPTSGKAKMMSLDEAKKSLVKNKSLFDLVQVGGKGFKQQQRKKHRRNLWKAKKAEAKIPEEEIMRQSESQNFPSIDSYHDLFSFESGIYLVECPLRMGSDLIMGHVFMYNAALKSISCATHDEPFKPFAHDLTLDEATLDQRILEELGYHALDSVYQLKVKRDAVEKGLIKHFMGEPKPVCTPKQSTEAPSPLMA